MEAFLVMGVGLVLAITAVAIPAVFIVLAYHGFLFLREIAFKGDDKPPGNPPNARTGGRKPPPMSPSL
jgi:hypothetical protein